MFTFDSGQITYIYCIYFESIIHSLFFYHIKLSNFHRLSVCVVCFYQIIGYNTWFDSIQFDCPSTTNFGHNGRGKNEEKNLLKSCYIKILHVYYSITITILISFHKTKTKTQKKNLSSKWNKITTTTKYHDDNNIINNNNWKANLKRKFLISVFFVENSHNIIIKNSKHSSFDNNNNYKMKKNTL